MTVTDILKAIRRRIAQTDLVTTTETDEDIMEYVSEASDRLSLRPVAGFSALTIDPVAVTIVPDPTLELGYMLVVYSTFLLLQDLYTGKLFTGALGGNWTSGLESESTISAEKAWKQALEDLQDELDSMILVKWGPISGVRAQ